jgi:hypothetical protein
MGNRFPDPDERVLFGFLQMLEESGLTERQLFEVHCYLTTGRLPRKMTRSEAAKYEQMVACGLRLAGVALRLPGYQAN